MIRRRTRRGGWRMEPCQRCIPATPLPLPTPTMPRRPRAFRIEILVDDERLKLVHEVIGFRIRVYDFRTDMHIFRSLHKFVLARDLLPSRVRPLK